MAIHQSSLDRLEKLKIILEKMIDSGVIWSKAFVCKELKVDRAFLCSRAKWQVSQQASRLYQDACEKVKDNNRLKLDSQKKAFASTWKKAEYLEAYCQELTEYNKQIRRQASNQIRGLKKELQEERDRVALLEAELESLRQSVYGEAA